jgi:hypothetical protein
MQICIAGWYYFEKFLKLLSNYSNVYIIAHKPGNSFNIPCIIVENIGLEFHCYDYFVKNIWDKKSDVLFCHDDIEINNISFLKDIELINNLITMIWVNESQKKHNIAHGRMFKCNAEYLKKNNGFWYDKINNGDKKYTTRCNDRIDMLLQSIKPIMRHFCTNKLNMGRRGIIDYYGKK